MINAKKITALVGAGAVALSIGSVLISPVASAQGGPVGPPIPTPVNRGAGVNGTHPNIRRAIGNLTRIATNLGKDPHDFGGHKSKAIQLINQAIDELNQALASAPR